jgi:hypothetical protein
LNHIGQLKFIQEPVNKEIRVFLASPGDLEGERQIFFEIMPKIGTSLGVTVVPIGYELIPSTVGERPQELINREVDACDLFVAVFYRHWGQSASESVVSSSYTEEEFNRAIRRYGKTGKPRIVCFFKNIDLHSLADPGPQLVKVLEFKRRLEESKLVLYRTFSSEADFGLELEMHLKAYVSKSLSDPHSLHKVVLLPVLADAEPDLYRNRDLALVEQATLAASNGRIEEAERLFAQLSQTTVTIAVLDTARTFFETVGNADACQAILDRKLVLMRDRRLAAQEYMASMMSYGWLDDMIKARLEITRPEDRSKVEQVFKLLFGSRFQELMIDVLAQNFTLGELRALGKFYGGEGASVSKKMAEFLGKILPPLIDELVAEVMKEFNAGMK